MLRKLFAALFFAAIFGATANASCGPISYIDMHPFPSQSSSPTVPWEICTPAGAYVPPSTQSQGLAEMLVLAQASNWNWTIEGGQDNNTPCCGVAYTAPTLYSAVAITFPAARNIHGQVNGVHLTTTVDVKTDCFIFDSQALANIEWHGGEITGVPWAGYSVVRLLPSVAVPVDPTVGIGSSIVKLPAISMGFIAGSGGPGIAVLRLTPSGSSGIAALRLQVGEVNCQGQAGVFGILVDAPSGGGTFSQNIIDVLNIHDLAGNGALAVSIGNGSGVNIFDNEWKLRGNIGAYQNFLATYAHGDTYEMNVIGNGAPGQAGVLEMGDHNSFSGVFDGVGTPYGYGPRPGSIYNAIVR